MVTQRRDAPLHLLVVSNTNSSSHLGGADRDWLNLANALGPDEIRLSWAGVKGCEFLRPHIDERVLARLIDLDFGCFYELLQNNMYRERSQWLWTKIIAASTLSLRAPLGRLSRAMRDDPADVVVTNTSVVMVGAAFARLKGLPHMWCVKEYLNPDVPGCRKLAWLINKTSSAVVVPSEPMAAAFDGRAQVFYDGNDVAGIQSSAKLSTRSRVLESLGLSAELPAVAQVGGIHWVKGQLVSAQSFLKLSREGGGDPRFSLLFLGGGKSEYREEIERTLAEAPAAWREAVRFVEFDPEDFSYLAAADIVVHPAVFPDPYPNAVREAMILGKPVIASRTGGLPYMIEDGETGVLIEPENAEALALALDALLEEPERRHRLGEAARRFAEERFDIRRRKGEFAELLHRVARNGARR